MNQKLESANRLKPWGFLAELGLGNPVIGGLSHVLLQNNWNLYSVSCKLDYFKLQQ